MDCIELEKAPNTLDFKALEKKIGGR